MRVLVCGSRHFNDQELLNKTLFEITKLDEVYNHGTVIHGNAKGADTLGALWGYRMGWKVEAYPADWDKYGKGAGHIRNKQMLDEGKPDLVVAFMAKDSRGTKNMVDQATKAGVEVKIINI